jgi:hypothetical protein
MFEIEYKGANSIIIATKQTTLVVDPKLSIVGLKNLAVKNVIELVTEPRLLVNDEESLLIDGPGEYEVGVFSIYGIAAKPYNDPEADLSAATIYRIEIGELRLALLGNIIPKLSDEQLELLGVLDMVILPIGGGNTLNVIEAANIIKSISPKVVIPVHYADSTIKYEVPQATFDSFAKALSAPVEDTGTKYKIKSHTTIPQALTIVRINRS